MVNVRVEDGVAYVALEEKEYKNTFTSRLIHGLTDAFTNIEQSPEAKVVVVYGFGNYFCCGGTRDELIGLHEGIASGEASFSELRFHDLLLRCRLPVISAMNGHALGAGLAFGCTADLIVMSEQSIYNAIFMKYGFTPGFGATYIIPKKLGETLGEEMLYTAQNFYGKDLKERGTSVRIVNRDQVLPIAKQLAMELADKPLLSLKTLKKHLVRNVITEFQNSVDKEIEMHKITFTQPEVRSRIDAMFGN